MTPEEIAAEVEKLRRSMIHGSTYRESMALDLIQMFANGKTKAQFCLKYDICANTFEKWVKRHKLFAVAYAKGHDHARAYYDSMRERYLEEDLFLDDDGEAKALKRINWGAFNRIYNTRFNIADKRAVKVKGFANAKTDGGMLKVINKGVEDGELTPDEAQKLAGLIDISLKIKHVHDLEIRMDAIENVHNKKS